MPGFRCRRNPDCAAPRQLRALAAAQDSLLTVQVLRWHRWHLQESELKRKEAWEPTPPRGFARVFCMHHGRPFQSRCAHADCHTCCLAVRLLSYECSDHFGNVVLFALWAWLATMQQPQQFYFELRSPYSVLWVSRTYFCGLPQRGSMTFNEALKHVTCVWAGALEVLSR
jgi:hypothetical protein